MRRASALLILATAACTRGAARPAPAPAPLPSASADVGANAITAQELRQDLFVFASDSFRGREAGTADAFRAARFIADRLGALGLEPAGDSGYYQRVPLTREGLGPTSKFTVTTPEGVKALSLGEDLVPLLSLGVGAPLPKIMAEGDIVFAGYGLKIPELRRDDLAGLDLAGKTVVFVNGAPSGLDSAKRAQYENPASIGLRLQLLAQKNPAAIIILLTGKPAEEYDQLAMQALQGSMTVGTAAAPANAPRLLPMMLVGVAKAGSPFLPAGWPASDKAQPLAGRKFSGAVQADRQTLTGYNVVAIVRGSDPALNHTYVAFGAHLDHIGIQKPVNGDSIANGADDDGSGSMGILAIARAMMRTSPKPRRSSLFVWHTGEEKGLLGSSWFTDHPTVPLDSVVAQLNADMIGRNASDSLYLVGPNAAPNGQSKVLGGIVDSVNLAMAMPFKINREWDSLTHPEHIYERSDHYNYAKHGVPIVFFTSGLHDDYHKVSDSPDKIDYDKLTRVSRLIYRAGVAVANRPTRPRPTQSP